MKKKSIGEILGRVTIPFGASMPNPGGNSDTLIDRAGACLYRPSATVDPEYAVATRSHLA